MVLKKERRYSGLGMDWNAGGSDAIKKGHSEERTAR